MIQANELRIGNWVVAFDKKFRQIDHLDIRDVFEKRLIVPFKPIPLTPEILEACRFEYFKECSYWHFTEKGYDFWYPTEGFDFPIAHKNGVFHKYFSCEDDFYSFLGPELKYLHQLQNLYFSLTGKELTVNIAKPFLHDKS